MIGEAVRFAWDERHGLPRGTYVFTDFNFSRQPKHNRRQMRSAFLRATLTGDKSWTAAGDHSPGHGLLLRGHRSSGLPGIARKTGGGRWRTGSSRRPDYV